MGRERKRLALIMYSPRTIRPLYYLQTGWIGTVEVKWNTGREPGETQIQNVPPISSPASWFAPSVPPRWMVLIALENNAIHTAASVACRWAGAVMWVFLIMWVLFQINYFRCTKKGPTYQPMDRAKKCLITSSFEQRCVQLLRVIC